MAIKFPKSSLYCMQTLYTILFFGRIDPILLLSLCLWFNVPLLFTVRNFLPYQIKPRSSYLIYTPFALRKLLVDKCSFYFYSRKQHVSGITPGIEIQITTERSCIQIIWKREYVMIIYKSSVNLLLSLFDISHSFIRDFEIICHA